MKFDFSEREYLRNVVSEIRLSKRFTKETIKRVQKKFTFYAECEFLRPLGQTNLSKSEPTTNREQSNLFELPRCGGGRR